jgi:toxin-antitoxin system PIN domain toxin
MRALLDVNVLLALFDRAHVHHPRAREWFSSRAGDGWASCPLTQNGFVRIISQPRYPQPITTARAMALLHAATTTDLHEFWPADFSLLDELLVDRSRIHGPRQVTDLYLLAMAVQRGGCLATFDDAIPLSAVPAAGPHHLVRI